MDNSEVKIEDLVDSDIEFIEKDSGMSSLGGSKDETPERRAEPVVSLEDDLEEKPSTSSSAEAPVAAEKPVEKEPSASVKSTVSAATPPPPQSASAGPSTTTTVATKDASDNYDDEPDETLGERLLGLTEMFPEFVRNFTGNIVDHTNSTIQTLYKFSCNASWIFFTSSIILFAPVIFETERAQMEEMQKTQQKQVLLGPGSAMAATGPPAPPMPSMR